MSFDLGAGDLRVHLDSSLPEALPAGRSTAVFCVGSCFHRRRRIAELEVVVDGERYPPAAWGMPRPDLFDMLHPDPASRRGPDNDPCSLEDPERMAYRSGFWATVPIEPRSPGELEIGLAAHLHGGGEAFAPLGRVRVMNPPAPPSDRGLPRPGLIAICMATFEPDIDLFRAQIESLRAQTDDRWTCVISDDCSSPERFAEILDVLGADPRFAISQAERRLKFYRNFERALSLAPAEAELFALCDQDDRWYPEKLAVLREHLGQAQLVYSDQRLVDVRGRVLRGSMWQGRRNDHTSLVSMLVANSITGAAALFRREVADFMLPFPDTPGMQFHDHWLGVVALAAGDIAYVSRPLYDYVQHEGAVFGDVARADHAAPARSRKLSKQTLSSFVRGGRGAYFLGYLPREMQARVLLSRCSDRLTSAKRRALERFIRSATSPLAFLWLAARPLRAVLGRNETLGSEIELALGITWRWVVPLLVAGSRTPGRRAIDARYPDPLSFSQKRLRRWRARL